MFPGELLSYTGEPLPGELLAANLLSAVCWAGGGAATASCCLVLKENGGLDGRDRHGGAYWRRRHWNISGERERGQGLASVRALGWALGSRAPPPGRRVRANRFLSFFCYEHGVGFLLWGVCCGRLTSPCLLARRRHFYFMGQIFLIMATTTVAN